jgi:hypothetical protein
MACNNWFWTNMQLLLRSASTGSDPAGVWMSVYCECCVLSGNGPRDGPIPQLRKFCRVYMFVSGCDQGQLTSTPTVSEQIQLKTKKERKKKRYAVCKRNSLISCCQYWMGGLKFTDGGMYCLSNEWHDVGKRNERFNLLCRRLRYGFFLNRQF